LKTGTDGHVGASSFAAPGVALDVVLAGRFLKAPRGFGSLTAFKDIARRLMILHDALKYPVLGVAGETQPLRAA
jgi:hypothetical protein